MARTPTDKVEREKTLLDELVADDSMTGDARDALNEWADALDGSITRHKFIDEDGAEKTLSKRSIHRYLQCLRLCEKRGVDLLTCSADAFNEFVDGQHDDRGLKKTTLIGYQVAAQSFYHYHDLGVDPADIHVYNERSKPRHDERDMFTEDEVEALRQACDKPRNRAFLELLIYTGQRITAIRTLRRKDVDCEDGYLYLNDEFDDEHDGMKGALDRGRKRPMFGARKFVRDWKHQYHPVQDDPDAPLFVGDPNHHRTKLDEPWCEAGPRKQLKRIAKRADVEKPVNPHNFRHYFVTVMKREYSMDSDTLRALLGVAEDSKVLETVYSHVTNEDYIRKSEEQLGYRERETPGTFTPDICATCGEQLKDHWKRCPACGQTYGPDMEELESETDVAKSSVLESSLGSDEPLSDQQREAVNVILNAVGDPVALADEIENRS